MKILLLAFVLGATQAFAGETVRIAIGTQDTTTNTAAGDPVPRELKLVEKYLPHDGKYKDVIYDVQWKSFPSGPPLNSELLAGKLDIGQMADFPAILGATAFQAANGGGFARKILDGQSTGVTTTHGIQVRSDFAEKYPELVVAYLKATLEADRLIRENPGKLSEAIAKWTGIDAEVVYAFHGPQGIQTRDYTLKPEFVNAIKQAQETLKILKKVEKPIDVDQFVNDKFIRRAAKEFGYDYEACLKDYSPVPLEGKDFASGEEVTDSTKAGQIWVAGEETVRLYKDVPSTFAALATLDKQGKKSRVVFVHDRENGLKLFADKVWYVRSGDDIAAFLEQSRAENWAQHNDGKLLTYAEARKFVGGERVAQAR